MSNSARVTGTGVPSEAAPLGARAEVSGEATFLGAGGKSRVEDFLSPKDHIWRIPEW